MPTNFTVSIGVPVHNAQKWIPLALEAVLAQTYSNLEIIICDNCSTDDTFRVCQEYADRDSRIMLLKNPLNLGAAGNFTEVFRHATGKYFKWASSNDLCEPRLVEACVDRLEQYPDVVVCYPRTKLIDESGTLIEEYVDGLHMLQDDPVERFVHYVSTVRLNNVEQGVIRRDVLARTPLQRDFLGTDTVLMAELALRGKYFEVPEFLFSRRMGREAASRFRSAADNARMYKPGADVLSAQTWVQMAAYARTAFTVPLSLKNRARLLWLIMRMGYWSKGDLFSEAGTFFFRGRRVS